MSPRAFVLIVFCLALAVCLTAACAAPAATPGAEEPTLVLPSTFTPTPPRTPPPVDTHTPSPTAPPPAAATETPAPIASTLSLEDQIAIYTAVIRRVYTVDHTFGQDPKFPVVYLVATSENRIDPSVREGVLAALASPSVRFEWVESAQAAPRDENGSVAGGGSVVALGEIQPLTEANKVGLDASISIAPLAAGGYNYVLEKIDGVWQVVDSIMQWIS